MSSLNKTANKTGEDVANEDVQPPRNVHEDLTGMIKDVYHAIHLFKTYGATSLQRAYPAQLCTRTDFSYEPLDGNFTSDLFLAHRYEAQSLKDDKRRRRRRLELGISSALGIPAAEELDEFSQDDDAESECSDISIQAVILLERGNEPQTIETDPLLADDHGLVCEDTCALSTWERPRPLHWFGDDEDSPDTLVNATEGASIWDKLLEGQIRILELEAGESGSPVSCQLHHIDLNSVSASDQYIAEGDYAPALVKYEALSYSWESSHLTCSILCNDTVWHITDNLFSALIQLRQRHRSRFLWVDALCINQFDNLEKSAQIPLMLRIFRQAQCVIVWLGKNGRDEGGLALVFLAAFDRQGWRHHVLEPTHRPECMSQLARCYTAVQKLFERSWFKRTWVRQELAAGQNVVVQCGANTISWGVLKRCSKRMDKVRSKLQEDSGEWTLPEISDGNLDSLRRHWMYGQSHLNLVAEAGSFYYWHGGGLLELLLAGTTFEATDPRDYIYAVLGLAREPCSTMPGEDALLPYLEADETFDPLPADYNASVSEVYQHFAKYIINRDLNLDILCFSGMLRGKESDDLPSWAPDWRFPLHTLPQSLTLKFRAASYTRADHQDYKATGTLNLQAYRVASIEEILPLSTSPWLLLYDNAERFIRSPGTVENKTLLGFEPMVRPLDPSNEINKCCTTSTGRIALVPVDARAGDSIFVALGGRLPFVLRRAPEVAEFVGAGSDTPEPDHRVDEYVMVGSCILPGFMQGEVFSVQKDEDVMSIRLV